MCNSRPSPPPAPKPDPIAPPPITKIIQGAPMEAGYSEAQGDGDNTMSKRRRAGSSVLRIPTIGGV
jgi:hypothetical protein|tara:strand:- start:246 stop:443 length:198 start_codon:yes stop_codon:yes gene_type:complete